VTLADDLRPSFTHCPTGVYVRRVMALSGTEIALGFRLNEVGVVRIGMRRSRAVTRFALNVFQSIHIRDTRAPGLLIACDMTTHTLERVLPIFVREGFVRA